MTNDPDLLGGAGDRHSALLALWDLDRQIQVRALGQVLKWEPDPESARDLARMLFAPLGPVRMNGAPRNRHTDPVPQAPPERRPEAKVRPDPGPCGTQQRYRSHLSLGETTDPACRQAHSEYVKNQPGGW